MYSNYSNLSQGKKAVALGYDEQIDTAPKVLASGSDLIAEHILEIAKANNIPIHQDADLVKILSVLEINAYIPLKVYEVVAKIISYIYAKDHKNKNK